MYLTVFTDIVVISVFITQFFPNIFDVILPLDEPRPRKLIITAKYFIFEDNYFIKLLHEFVLIAISASIVFATSSQLIVFCCHSFGMFEVVRYRSNYIINLISFDCALN